MSEFAKLTAEDARVFLAKVNDLRAEFGLDALTVIPYGAASPGDMNGCLSYQCFVNDLPGEWEVTTSGFEEKLPGRRTVPIPPEVMRVTDVFDSLLDVDDDLSGFPRKGDADDPVLGAFREAGIEVAGS